jgi:hypothetical protein
MRTDTHRASNPPAVSVPAPPASVDARIDANVGGSPADASQVTEVEEPPATALPAAEPEPVAAPSAPAIASSVAPVQSSSAPNRIPESTPSRTSEQSTATRLAIDTVLASYVGARGMSFDHCAVSVRERDALVRCTGGHTVPSVPGGSTAIQSPTWEFRLVEQSGRWAIDGVTTP